MKKTIALTLLGLASAFALSTTAVKAEETAEVKNTEKVTNSNVEIKGSVLEFRDVSGSLEFGTLTIDGNGQTASATDTLNLTVADLRGTREGWTVTAEHAGLLSTVSGKDDELEGATITLNNGDLDNNIDPGTNNPTFASNNIISTNESNISIAESGKGMGLWSHNWAVGGVKLTIPAIEARDMYEGQYATTITWKLTAGPQATDSTSTDEN